MLDLVQEARRVRRDSSSQPMLSELERIAERMKIHGFVTEVTGSDQTVVRYRGQLYDLADWKHGLWGGEETSVTPPAIFTIF